MALRILHFSAVLAVGYTLGPNPEPTIPRAFDTSKNLSLSLRLSDPQDVFVQRGQSATLKCNAETNDGSDLEFTWFYGNESIPSDDTRWTIYSNGSLFIPQVVGKKSNGVTGEYKCLVRNKAGALLSNAARLKVASIDPDFLQDPVNQTVPVGQSAALSCSPHSTPPAEIQWEFNNLPLPHDTRYVPLPNGLLFIQNVQSSDTGFYRCKATNDIHNKTKYSKSAELSVTAQSQDAAPTFLPLDNLPNRTVYIGNDLRLYCPVIGWPTPTVQWLDRHGLVIATLPTLLIPNVQSYHSGEYVCSSYNSLGHASQTYQVEVLQKPFFSVMPASRSFPPSSTVRMECRAGGLPEPKITWLKNGQVLHADTRVKKPASGLVIRQSFTGDSGIYQCVAANPAGKIWAAAHILINASQTEIPPPPINIQCRPYDSWSICLSWAPPNNVSALAYSIHSVYHSSDGRELSGPENVTNMTSQLVEGLNSSTNYTFYVRGYSKAASDSSEKVICTPGIVGNRNLQIEIVKPNSVLLTWSEINLDRTCEGKSRDFEVHWREEGQKTSFSECTSSNQYLVNGLAPSTYEFLVTPNDSTSTWKKFTIPDIKDNSSNDDPNEAHDIPSHPKAFEGTPISGTSVALNWSSSGRKAKFFTICYVPSTSKEKCENGTLLESRFTKLQVDKLEPNTTYMFKIRGHNSDRTAGPFSKSIEIRTPEEVPSPVLELKYKIINETTVCLYWVEPQHKNGNIQWYIISYTPDKDWLLEQWLNVTIPWYQNRPLSCWIEESDWLTKREVRSMVLGNLSSEAQYMVLVRAVSEVGIGRPTYPIIVNTKILLPVANTDYEYHQKAGIIIGTIIAVLCVVLCIICILVRRRCLKRQALARARTAASNNYYPAVAHYASHVGAVQVRLEDTCAAQTHEESQHLVYEGPGTNIPPVLPGHCDTKGSEEYPNGHLNGVARPHMNGQVMNNQVHITENPQYYTFETDSHPTPRKSKKSMIPLHFEEDSNSNVKSSKFYDLYRLFENSKKASPKYHQCNPRPQDSADIQDSADDLRNEEESLNTTHLTCLDDSLNINMVNNNRQLSPILGPNG